MGCRFFISGKFILPDLPFLFFVDFGIYVIGVDNLGLLLWQKIEGFEKPNFYKIVSMNPHQCHPRNSE